MLSDPISDLLARIRNAYLVKHEELLLPYSRIKEEIVKILVNEGYLDSYSVVGEKPKQNLKIKLKYINQKPAITGLKRVSKPGRRLYAAVADIPKTLGGYGITIVSTNKGLLTDKQARKLSVGGELICQIW